MDIVKNFNLLLDEIKNITNEKINLIAVTKNFNLDYIKPLINIGHIHFGENRVQEALTKWGLEKKIKPLIQIHLIGKLQSNKVKDALNIFDYIHSLDSKKLAILLNEEEEKKKIKIKYFIQVNIGLEKQKSGVMLDELEDFINFCRSQTKLNIIGLMCIPPLNGNSSNYFETLRSLAKKNNLAQLSMGMSGDYIEAIKCGSTFLRVGSKIFGERSN
jgi:pyridoxal phosphate enzyme (YggS family)